MKCRVAGLKNDADIAPKPLYAENDLAQSPPGSLPIPLIGMKKNFVSTATLLFTLLTISSAYAFSQDSGPVKVKLSMANGKTIYRSGEPITLVLSFTSDAAGFIADTVVEPGDTYMDQVSISPASGVFNWRREFMRGAIYASDVSVPAPLSAQPVEVKFALNSSFRFDAVGKYTVHVKTKRAGVEHRRDAKFEPPLELTTNDVSFEIRPMSEVEEAAETARVAAALDASKDHAEQVRLADQLSYLVGDAAISEKVRRFVAPQDIAKQSYGGSMRLGLFISRDRSAVIKLLEDILNDTSRPVDFELLSTLSSLRSLQMMAAAGITPKPHASFMPPDDDGETIDATQFYIDKLIENLPNRPGANRTSTAVTILLMLPKRDSSNAALEKLRSIIVKNFDGLEMFSREYLLSAQWDRLKDMSLIPSIERMLTDKNYPDYGRMNVHTTAIKRLIELDKERARPFVIAEVQDAASLLTDDAFETADYKPMPEVDDALLKQISTLGQSEKTGRDSVFLRNKCLLAARFATDSIYDQLMEVYKTSGPKWEWNSRALLLGYFARYKPEEAIALVETELKTLSPDWQSSFLNDFTRVNYPPEVAAFFEARLASNDPLVAGSAAYIISKHGNNKARAKIEVRLKQWVDRWKDKYFELEGPQLKAENANQANLQVELIMALISGKSWKISDDDKKLLQADCLTAICKQTFHW